MSRRDLVRQLEKAREEFAGIGTRKAKIRLNKLAKTCQIARAFRIALEIEDSSTTAKKYGSAWSYEYYEKKHRLIHELMEICREKGWLFGKHPGDGFPRWIIYFELPDCEQISFHCNSFDSDVPDYPHEWDRKTHSTLGKLEVVISELLK